jgi:hypothetical protein
MKRNRSSLALALGIALGAAVGAATGEMGLWLGIGAGLGAGGMSLLAGIDQGRACLRKPPRH